MMYVQGITYGDPDTHDPFSTHAGANGRRRIHLQAADMMVEVPTYTVLSHTQLSIQTTEKRERT